jgi:hypothetical protein
VGPAILVSLGQSAQFELSSRWTIQLNTLVSTEKASVISLGCDASNSSSIPVQVQWNSDSSLLVNRNVLVSKVESKSPAVFKACLRFTGLWWSNSNIARVWVSGNVCFPPVNSATKALITFDSPSPFFFSTTLIMGPCDKVSSRVLAVAADYVAAGAPAELRNVRNCTTFSESEVLLVSGTRSAILSHSSSPQDSATGTSLSVLRPLRSQSFAITRSFNPASMTLPVASDSSPMLSTTGSFNVKSPTINLVATSSVRISPSHTLTFKASLELRDAGRGQLKTLSLTTSQTASASLTKSVLLTSPSSTLQLSASCVPFADLAEVSSLFSTFRLFTDVHETEDFTPLLPRAGVLRDVWASSSDALMFNAATLGVGESRVAGSSVIVLPVVLSRRVSYPAPSVVPLQSFAPGAIIGNGTVSMFNATMSLFDVRQWSAAEPYRAGDILEIRFSVDDWFAVTRQGRAARAIPRPVPCRPNDTIVLAFIELGGALSATQAAVRAVVGTVSTVAMIVSLGVGDGGGDLQTLILVSMLECTPKGGSVQNSLANLRSLAPLLIEDSYLGVILGNITLVCCVLGAQCIAMACIALIRCAVGEPIHLGSIKVMYSSSRPEGAVATEANDVDGEEGDHRNVVVNNVSSHFTVGEPLNIEDESAEPRSPHFPAILTSADVDAATSAPQRRNGFPVVDEQRSIMSLVLFPGALFSVVAFAFQGTLFAGIRLMQLYRAEGTAVSEDSKLFAIGAATTVLLIPLPFVVVFVLNDRMYRSYHRYLVPLRTSRKRLNILHRHFSTAPALECSGVMLPRDIGRVWGPLVSSCLPHRAWCALPFASGWIMCVAALVQFSTTILLCTSVLVVVAFANVVLAVLVFRYRPRISTFLNHVLVLLLCNNAAALFANAVSIHITIHGSVIATIGLIQSFLSCMSTIGAIASTLANVLQWRQAGLLGIVWHIGPLSKDAECAEAATGAVCASLARTKRLLSRALRLYEEEDRSSVGDKQNRLIEKMLFYDSHSALSELFCESSHFTSEHQELENEGLGTVGLISGMDGAGIDDLTEWRHKNTSLSFLVQRAATEREIIDIRVENGEPQQFFYGGPTEIISDEERFGVFRELGIDL